MAGVWMNITESPTPMVGGTVESETPTPLVSEQMKTEALPIEKEKIDEQFKDEFSGKKVAEKISIDRIY